MTREISGQHLLPGAGKDADRGVLYRRRSTKAKMKMSQLRKTNGKGSRVIEVNAITYLSWPVLNRKFGGVALL